MVIGNSPSYGLLCAVAAPALTALIVGPSQVPVFGPYWQLAVGLGLLIAASLGNRIVASPISPTEQQAAQPSMLILLCSIFFSRFVFSLDRIASPVRLVSDLPPTTYAMRNCRT